MNVAPTRPFRSGDGDLLPNILHLDHSTEAGGAELALLRVLIHATSWHAVLRLPKPGARSGIGVFEPLRSHSRVEVDESGVPQKAGASKASIGPARLLTFAVDTVREAVTLRRSSGFRNASILHANTSRSAVYAAIACVFTRKILILHLRDMTSKESLGSLGFALYSRVALRRANGVIANSQSTLKSAEPHLAASAFRTVIPSPIGFDNRAIRTVPTSSVRSVGMVARIDPWKGQELLLEAFAAACSGSGIRLILAGGASFGKDADLDLLIRRAAELGVSGQVDFLGHVDDVRAVIEQMDICVQASIRPEPLGQNILQYLVAGKPIIAVDAGGPAEWIQNGRNGVLVEMNSVESMASAIRLLTKDADLRRELAENALATKGIGTDVEIANAHGAAFMAALTRSTRR